MSKWKSFDKTEDGHLVRKDKNDDGSFVLQDADAGFTVAGLHSKDMEAGVNYEFEYCGKVVTVMMKRRNALRDKNEQK
jgi:hypothetical protein